MPQTIARTFDVCYDSVLAVMYPQRCEVCGGSVEKREFGVACERCWHDAAIFKEDLTRCWKCGRPSTQPVGPAEQVRCHRCDEDDFTAARACGAYNGALRASVLALKQQPYLAKKLLNLLLGVQRQPPLSKATCIIPVPLHPERQKMRGFNQAEAIAKAISRRSGIPFDGVSLIRTRHVEHHRAGMDAEDRRKSVDNAFKVIVPAMISNQKVLLVDDVFTTGATVSSCARVLFEAGAQEVFVLTIARPVYP